MQAPLFLMRVLVGQPDTRISAVAPLKIAKKAVSRNRIRRKMYESLAPLMDSINHGLWIALFAKKDIGEMETVEMTKEISSFFRNAKILLA